MYYTGHRKGQLTVTGKVLTQGKGLDDLFWVKTAPTGEATKFKTFFSPYTDNTVADGLRMGNGGQIYFLGFCVPAGDASGLPTQAHSLC
jgi:hypothetical protein